MGVDVQRHVLAALPPGKKGYLFYTKLGGPQDRSGWGGKIHPHGFRTPNRPARSGSLYRLRYSTPLLFYIIILKWA
jgi:hypothetical protein